MGIFLEFVGRCVLIMDRNIMKERNMVIVKDIFFLVLVGIIKIIRFIIFCSVIGIIRLLI